ncbi:hypothetical protein FB45DRAFT_926102 [Roridomyces roridus]|uniref:Uncharacterized protein n=1 Tax=Roridomyces roridus TaxID=1738132 RepID=A0AAD7FGW4_9AGAR|nr:hypothetical protein FB45DRAFT_926102 [Roridomyces roridus]
MGDFTSQTGHRLFEIVDKHFEHDSVSVIGIEEVMKVIEYEDPDLAAIIKAGNQWGLPAKAKKQTQETQVQALMRAFTKALAAPYKKKYGQDLAVHGRIYHKDHLPFLPDLPDFRQPEREPSVKYFRFQYRVPLRTQALPASPLAKTILIIRTPLFMLDKTARQEHGLPPHSGSYSTTNSDLAGFPMESKHLHNGLIYRAKSWYSAFKCVLDKTDDKTTPEEFPDTFGINGAAFKPGISDLRIGFAAPNREGLIYVEAIPSDWGDGPALLKRLEELRGKTAVVAFACREDIPGSFDDVRAWADGLPINEDSLIGVGQRGYDGVLNSACQDTIWFVPLSHLRALNRAGLTSWDISAVEQILEPLLPNTKSRRQAAKNLLNFAAASSGSSYQELLRNGPNKFYFARHHECTSPQQVGTRVPSQFKQADLRQAEDDAAGYFVERVKDYLERQPGYYETYRAKKASEAPLAIDDPDPLIRAFRKKRAQDAAVVTDDEDGDENEKSDDSDGEIGDDLGARLDRYLAMQEIYTMDDDLADTENPESGYLQMVVDLKRIQLLGGQSCSKEDVDEELKALGDEELTDKGEERTL